MLALEEGQSPPEDGLCGEGDAGDCDCVNIARFDLIGKDAERQGPRKLRCLALSFAVNQYTWKLRDLSDPAAVGFLLELDRERHVNQRGVCH
jgi:hypothetical protein